MAPIFMLLLALAATAQIGPQEPATFRAGVALVRVDAQVVDRAGADISGLVKEDFRILDNGQPQTISYFAHESEPLDLLLLLDVSGSMSRILEETARTTESALRQLHAGDRAGLMLFARESAMREPFTADFGRIAAEIRRAVHDRSLGSGTAINSAIVAAAQVMQAQSVRGRRAILIVTDNTSLNYRVPDDETLRALYAADTVLNGIIIGRQRPLPSMKPGAYVNPDFTPTDVRKIAEHTGGEALQATRPEESLAGMIERIRARYSMQYAAPDSVPGTWHRITVDLMPHARDRHPSAVVRARTGYYAGP